jgi:hypothetical protein
MESIEEVESDTIKSDDIEAVGIIKEEVTLDYDYAIARTAMLLDYAGDLAVRNQSIDDLLKVSAGWLALSQNLAPADEDEPEEPMGSGPIGFVPGEDDDSKD